LHSTHLQNAESPLIALVLAAGLFLLSAGVGAAAQEKPAAKANPIAAARQAVASAKTPVEKARLQEALARLLVRAGKKQEALAVYVQMATSDDRATRQAAARQLAKFCAQHRDLPPADVVAAHLALARREENLSQREQIAAQLFRLFRRRGGRRDGRAEVLIKLLENEAARRPKDVAVYLLMGYAYYGSGDYARAADAYRKAVDLDNADRALRVRLARSCDYAGRHGEAGALFEKLAEETPAQAAAYHRLAARAFARGGRAEAAQRHLDEYLRLTPGTSAAAEAAKYYNVGAIYGYMGKDDQAIECFRKAIGFANEPRFRNQQETYWWYLLTFLTRKGRVKEAEVEGKRMLDAFENTRYRKQILARLRQVLLVRGAEESIRLLQREITEIAAADDTGWRRYWRHLLVGELAEQEDDYAAALGAYEQARALRPEAAKALVRKINWLRITAEKRRREMEAVLKSPGRLWAEADPHRKDTVWVAFPNRLVVVDRRSGRRREYGEFFGYAHWQPRCVAFDPERVWLGTDRGLFAFDREDGFWRRYALAGGRLEADIRKVTAGEGTVRVAVCDGRRTRTYLMTLETETWREE